MPPPAMPAAPFAELRDGLVEFRLGHGPVAIGVEAVEHRLGVRCPAARPRIGHFLERHRPVAIGIGPFHHPVDTARHPFGRRRPATRPGRARRRHWRRPRRTGPRGRLPSRPASPHRRRSGPSLEDIRGPPGGPSCATAGRTRAVGIMTPRRAAFHIDMRLLLCLPVCPHSRRRRQQFRRKKFCHDGLGWTPARRGHVRAMTHHDHARASPRFQPGPPDRPAWPAIAKGLRQRCPSCGEGSLYHGLPEARPTLPLLRRGPEPRARR
jgi:hypothetical protein